MEWRIHHRAETVSTNLDARAGRPGDVFTADFQTAGRGRLDHKWLSPPGANLMMSVVLSVGGLPPEQVATLPLVIGLAVCEGVGEAIRARLKWPNDVLVEGRKLAGILCERRGDDVIVGVGVNVGQVEFPPEIAARATSLARLCGRAPTCAAVRDGLLERIGDEYGRWRRDGFAVAYPRIVALDCLKGRRLTVVQTDSDEEPIGGVCGGIRPDGSLDVGGRAIYAGEVRM